MSTTPTGWMADEELSARMQRLGLREEDIEEVFVRSRGHGGQNVNKTSTCVMLLHRPTGVQVKCQETREQGRNRSIARRLLVEKLEQREEERRAAKRAAQEKARRQKRGRSRAGKERMLREKARRAEKKQWRRGAE